MFGATDDMPPIDVVYVAPGSSLHMSVVPQGQAQPRARDDAPTSRAARPPLNFDVCYVTRLQGERLAPGQTLAPTIR